MSPQVTAILLGGVGPAGKPGVIPYTHVQETVSATWEFAHTLERFPASVALYDAEGNMFEASIRCPDESHVVVTMEPGLACSGKAVLI